METARAAAKTAKTVEKTAAKPAAIAATKKAAKTATTVVRFSLNGEYPEGPSEGGMFGELQPSLGKLIERLDEAKADKDVAAVWLRIEDLELGRGKVNEVRAAIARVRKAGKPVYAELTSADTGAYLVASACDHIYMPVSGMLIVPGVRMEVTFYKGLLDKLGLKFDALRMGKYKGFVEPMSRESMSAPLRESLQSIVDDAYDDMIATIAKDRHLQDYQVKSLVDQGLFSATAAQEAGLIDEVLYADQFEESLGKRLKVDRVEVETAYKKKQIDTDFSGIGGFVKLMEAFSGGKKSEKSSSKQKIAVVYAVGEITEGKSHSGLFSGSLARFDDHDRDPQEGIRRLQGRGRGPADRQPRRIGHRQRLDLAGNGPRQDGSRWWPAWATWPAAAATTSPWAPRRSLPSRARSPARSASAAASW